MDQSNQSANAPRLFFEESLQSQMDDFFESTAPKLTDETWLKAVPAVKDEGPKQETSLREHLKGRLLSCEVPGCLILTARMNGNEIRLRLLAKDPDFDVDSMCLKFHNALPDGWHFVGRHQLTPSDSSIEPVPIDHIEKKWEAKINPHCDECHGNPNYRYQGAGQPAREVDTRCGKCFPKASTASLAKEWKTVREDGRRPHAKDTSKPEEKRRPFALKETARARNDIDETICKLGNEAQVKGFVIAEAIKRVTEAIDQFAAATGLTAYHVADNLRDALSKVNHFGDIVSFDWESQSWVKSAIMQRRLHCRLVGDTKAMRGMLDWDAIEQIPDCDPFELFAIVRKAARNREQLPGLDMAHLIGAVHLANLPPATGADSCEYEKRYRCIRARVIARSEALERECFQKLGHYGVAIADQLIKQGIQDTCRIQKRIHGLERQIKASGMAFQFTHAYTYVAMLAKTKSHAKALVASTSMHDWTKVPTGKKAA